MVVDTEAGPFRNRTVLFLGSSRGTILKFLILPNSDNTVSTGNILLEELEGFNADKYVYSYLFNAHKYVYSYSFNADEYVYSYSFNADKYVYSYSFNADMYVYSYSFNADKYVYSLSFSTRLHLKRLTGPHLHQCGYRIHDLGGVSAQR